MKNVLPESFGWAQHDNMLVFSVSGLTLGFTDGHDELKGHVMLSTKIGHVLPDGAAAYVAMLTLNGHRIHESEHVTRQAAVRACEQAARRAFAVRWAP